MRRFILAFCSLLLASLACNAGTQSIPPTPENSIFDSGKTAYGFFPSPPEATLESILQLYKDISAHGDFVLISRLPKADSPPSPLVLHKAPLKTRWRTSTRFMISWGRDSHFGSILCWMTSTWNHMPKKCRNRAAPPRIPCHWARLPTLVFAIRMALPNRRWKYGMR